MKPIDFIKIAIKNYKKVGAITVSSRHAVTRIISALKPEYKYIIEYGAGNGVITKAILNSLPGDGKVVAIEINKELFSELTKIRDSRLDVFNEDILRVSKHLADLGLPRIDAVISGIPLSFLKSRQRKELIQNTSQNIAERGKFILYQTSLIILPVLKKYFKKVTYKLELRNLPPYFIMVAEK